MTKPKTTPSATPGTRRIDPLLDRSCVLLDGHCDCEKPWEDCKHIHHPEGNKNVYQVIQEQQMKEWDL